MKLTKRILSAVLALSLTAGVSLPAVSAYDISGTVSLSAENTDNMETYAAEYRKHLVNRETEFSIYVPAELMDDVNNVFKLISLAVKDTPESSPVEGDYLAWVLGPSNFSFEYKSGRYEITTSMSYHTTAEQEAELDKKVTEILDELDVYSANDYEKIKAVHDYIIENVSYYSSGDMICHTAYGAGINGKAVCEGYSLLMYRLLSELGINVRCIPGIAGGSHMWNMVELYGKYYYIDVTFDDGMANKYAYFLKGSEDFDDYSSGKPHKFSTDNFTSSYYADYTDGDFLARFDISPTAFDPSAPVVTTTVTAVTTTSAVTTTVPPVSPDYIFGDIDGDGMITANDASIVLAAYAAAATGRYSKLTERQEISADINKDGKIDASDASIILAYYAYTSTTSGEPEALEDWIDRLL